MPNFSIPTSALNAFDTVVQTTANNIANINSTDFKSRHIVLQSGSYMDEGVRVASIYRDMTPGPAVINHLGENDVRDQFESSARGLRISQDNYDTAVAQDLDRTQQANTGDAWHIEDYRNGQVAAARIRGYVEGSNTNLPREFANLISIKNAYSANVATIRAMDEMVGSILNVKI